MSGLHFEPGHTISHFRLEKKLGEGGMGAVFLAEDLTLNRPVAIKFMSRSILAQQATIQARESLEQRFIREARSAAAINHPNLAQIYEANFESDNWFIAMEYINGHDLIRHMEEHGQFSVEEIYHIARQTIAGLRHAWNHHKILHRDIKPQNIMLTHEQVVKIVDLGLAKPLNDPAAEAQDQDLTLVGTAVGTPRYMAPEQATGERNLTCAVDIYALGATLYEIITSEKTFDATSPAMIYMAQMSREYVPLRERRPEVPKELEQLIERMLEPKRVVRISNYDEILQCLGVRADGISVTSASLGGSVQSDLPEYLPDQLILGRYRVTRNLGRSRAGIAYLCLDTESRMECVVKSLAPDREFPAADLPWIRENFQRLMGMAHPNLVQIRDLRQDETTRELFVVMEKLDGLDLRQFTHRLVTESGQLELGRALPVMQATAMAVDAVHQAFGRVHNDLKPESIFLTDNGSQVKLLDYGITLRSSAKSGRALESPDYMAPEKWRGEPAGPKSDQYALGVIFYEMLARKLPFWLHDPDLDTPPERTRGDTDEAQLLEHLKERVLNEAPPMPDGPAKINRVLAKALAKRPDQRYANCTAFGKALLKPANGARRGMLLIAAAALVGIAIVGFFAFTFLPVTPARSDVDPPTGAPRPAPHAEPAEPPHPHTSVRDAQQRAQEEPLQPTAADAARRRLAEEEARLKQEAALLQRLRYQAAEQEKAFDTRLGPLKEHPMVGDALNSAMQQADRARAIDPATRPAERLAAWHEALRETDRAESVITLRQREWVLEAREELRVFHQQIRRYEAWDPKIAEAFVAYDVTEALAREAINREDFNTARTHLEAGLVSLRQIDHMVRGRFSAVRGRDFVVGQAGIDMRWLDAMGLWASTFEITNGQYRKFKPAHSSKQFEGLNMNADNQPVCWVNYFEALAFCAWLNSHASLKGMLPEGYVFRLPSEKEWRMMASAGNPDRVYPWGDQWPPPHGNYGNREVFPETWALEGFTDPFPVTCAVDKSGRNEWGLYGMHGNLWEWTSTEKNGQRAVCGGAWSSCDKRLAALDLGGNNFADPQEAYDNVGIRILLSPKAGAD